MNFSGRSPVLKQRRPSWLCTKENPESRIGFPQYCPGTPRAPRTSIDKFVFLTAN